LRLPVRTPQDADDNLPEFPAPEISTPLDLETLRPPRREHAVTRDQVNNWITLKQVNDDGRIKYLDHGLETDYCMTETFRVREGDPLSVNQHFFTVTELQREEWHVRVETDSRMTADATHFYLSNRMDAYEGDVRVFTKSWTKAIPRDNV
jgi:hypothetical protein